MKSIYTNADPALLKLFERAGSPRKVLCAALDFAKQSHTALLCNGMGDLLKKPFTLPNSAKGLEVLLTEVNATCRHRHIQPKHVFFGGEDTPSYAENFVTELRQRGFLVCRVNAFDAKKQRENLQASTDELDLHGIAHCLLKGRARVLAEQPGLHQQLRLLVRERDFLVHKLTAVINHLHPHVDRLFPTFLTSKENPVEPRSPAAWWLMSSGFSAPQIARRKLGKLAQGLEDHGVSDARQAAQQLQDLAKEVLPPDQQIVPVSQFSVENLTRLAAAVDEAIAAISKQTAAILLQSPAARLTTIPGIGLNLGAGLGAEMSLLDPIPSLSRICSYAGIIPAIEQTGGPEKEARTRPTFPHYSRRLKCYLLQAGEHMARIRQSDAWELRRKTEANGQHTARVLGKHAAAVTRAVLVAERAYLPARLYDPHSSATERGQYYQQYWPKLVAKWRKLASLQQVFDARQPLGRWRNMVQQAYGISLPLPGREDENSNHQPKENEQELEENSLDESLS